MDKLKELFSFSKSQANKPKEQIDKEENLDNLNAILEKENYC
jgi:hypothetical protein